jgi:hypothetical protein
MQLLIDIGIDPAGNVWVDNNWQDLDSCLQSFSVPALPQYGAFGLDDLRSAEVGLDKLQLSQASF